MDKDHNTRHIIIAGGSGLIGTALSVYLRDKGHKVYVLSRRHSEDANIIQWDPRRATVSKDVFQGDYAIVNLCGQSLADHRWTKKYKARLLQSREQPAQCLAQLIAASGVKPASYIGISGIGIYGDQATLRITEDSTVEGMGFIPSLVRKWESAHEHVPAQRTIILRTGVVITSKGGFLEKLRLPRYFGLYPYFCSGKQILSWIHINDLVRVIKEALSSPEASGRYHATAPEAVSLKELTKSYRRAAGTPGLLIRIPGVFLKLGLGELGAMLCESADIVPQRLLNAGFTFHYPSIDEAMRAELNST